MPKITRANQKQFGVSAGATGVAVFGSLKDGTPTYSYVADTIQNLPAFEEGWYGALIGLNSMAVEDRNAIDFLFSRQLAYIMQTGIPEWSALTTYYIGSLAISSTGAIYYSIADDNLNNALTDLTKWTLLIRPSVGTAVPAGAIGQELIFTASGTWSVTTANYVTFQLPVGVWDVFGQFVVSTGSVFTAGANARATFSISTTPTVLESPSATFPLIGTDLSETIANAGLPYPKRIISTSAATNYYLVGIQEFSANTGGTIDAVVRAVRVG